MSNCIILVCLNVLFFVSNTYPKHIFESNTPHFPIAMMINVVFFLLFVMLLAMTFSCGEGVFSKDLSLRKIRRGLLSKKSLLFIGVWIVTDIIRNLTSGYFGMCLTDMITVGLWLFGYILFVDNDTNILKRKNYAIVVIGISAALLAVSCLVSAGLMEDSNYVVEKYVLFSPKQTTALTNLSFFFEIKNFVLDTAVGITLIAAHRIFIKKSMKKGKVKKKIFAKVIGINIVWLLAIIVLFIKIVVFPYSCMSFRARSTGGTAADGRFMVDTFTYVFTRNGQHGAEEILARTRVTIKYKNKSVESFMLNNNNTLNVLAIEVTELDVDGVQAGTYNDAVICYVENGNPKAILSEELPNAKPSQTLTKIVRALIEQHKFEFFDTGAKYLLRHDPDFIRPYLKKYSAAYFTDDEQYSIQKNYINPEFVVKTAIELMK